MNSATKEDSYCTGRCEASVRDKQRSTSNLLLPEARNKERPDSHDLGCER